MNEEELWLYTLCRKNGVLITDIQIRRLSLFKNLLLDWNKKINLVSRKNEHSVWTGHVAVSLSMLFKIEFRSGMNILDLGTGGGFPGIPLAIMLPECSFLLLDSTQKKITAVQSMITSLGLPNVKTLWGRAEEVQRNPSMRGTFDAVVARSVTNLTDLFQWGFPFLKRQAGNNLLGEKTAIITPSLITFKGVEIDLEEKNARIKFPRVALHHIPLIFPGNENFENLEKKLIVATMT